MLQWRTSLQNKSFFVGVVTILFRQFLTFRGWVNSCSWDFCQNSWFHLFYFNFFILFFYFVKLLICWKYLALRSVWIEQNSDAVEIVFELALYEVCAVVVVEVSEVNENVADIIELSAAFGYWVKFLSLFRRKSEFCNNFQFGDLLVV